MNVEAVDNKIGGRAGKRMVRGKRLGAGLPRRWRVHHGIVRVVIVGQIRVRLVRVIDSERGAIAHGRVHLPRGRARVGGIWLRLGGGRLAGALGLDSVIDTLCHAVKVHEQAQKHFVGGWAVLVYSAKIAEDGNGGDVLAVKSKDGVAKRAHVGARGIVVLVGLLLVGDIALHRVVLQIVGRGDFGEQSGDHVNDVVYGHGTNLVLGQTGRAGGGGAEAALLDEDGDVSEIADVDNGLRSGSTEGRRQGTGRALGSSRAGRRGLDAIVVRGR